LIGNDIVDLSAAKAESNWKRKGYLEKIFTEAERFLIHVSKDANLMVWLFWTMKEAVYKAAENNTQTKTFAPSALSCNNLILHENSACGTVDYKGKKYYCNSILTPDYIHTIAADCEKTLALISLKIKTYNISDQSYKNLKPDSVSHHGRYLALINLSGSLQSAS
jgi:phosphopantetheinyl transferase (holo-ACP synthase)